LSQRFWRGADGWWKVNEWGADQWMALVLVFCMAALFFITQKQLMSKNMSPEALQGPMAQQQKMMLYMFPVFYLFMGMSIPIGVLVYWVVSNLWTLGQQFVLIRNNPTPGTPAFLAWEDRMIRQGKDPAEIQAERLRKRMGKPAEPTKKETDTSSDNSTGVQRQQIQRQVVRQQPKKSRAQRKGPNNTGNTGNKGGSSNKGPTKKK
jgi:YidC/Oxa1 family membrane protein insertase